MLFSNESVLLPGFGTFYTKYQPARFVPEEQKIEPPAKTIAFDPAIKDGESLLIPALVEKEGRSLDEVERYVGEFVNEVNHLLEAGKKVELEKLGVFSIGPSGNMHFEPDLSVTYLPGNMGAVSNPASGSIQDTVSTEVSKSPGLSRPVKWVAYALVPMIIICIIAIINFDFIFGKRSIFRVPPQAYQEAPHTTPAPAQIAEPDALPPAVVPEETPIQPDAAPAVPAQGKMYYVVVGSFPDESIAKDYANKLRSEGAPLASVFMKTASGFHRVSYGYYHELAEAEEALARAKQQFNADAYILHR